MSYTTRDEIPKDQLAEQWGVPATDIGGIMNAARSGKKLYNALRDEGFSAIEFPEWWYRPAPAKRTPAPNQLEVPINEVSEVSEIPNDLENKVLKGQAIPAIHSTPQLAGSQLAGAGIQQAGSAGEVQRLAYTAEQVQLLASKGVGYNAQDGTWIKVTPQGRGSYVETVNPDAVLIKIREERTQQSYMNNIADETLKNLSLTTQAILKKVALNPSVFQCFQYVSNMRDPDTSAILFNGDFGDYISWAMLWATTNSTRAQCALDTWKRRYNLNHHPFFYPCASISPEA